MSKRIRANKEAFKLFQAELSKRGKKIQSLTAELVQLANTHKEEMFEAQINIEMSNYELRKLRADYSELLSKLNSLEIQANRDSVATTSQQNSELPGGIDLVLHDKISDNETQKGFFTLETAQPFVTAPSASVLEGNSAESKTFGRMAAELQLLRDEVAVLSTKNEVVMNELSLERIAVQEAATVAVQANIRRAELQAENSDLLNELIDVKVEIFHLCFSIAVT